MAIKKKIEIVDLSEQKKRETFISKGGSVSSDKKSRQDSSMVLVKIPCSLLAIVDEMVSCKPWQNRTKWIVEAIHQKIEKGD